jgi:hypothetical protein
MMGRQRVDQTPKGRPNHVPVDQHPRDDWIETAFTPLAMAF